ncbi:hypothetical protein GOODEAATRI_032677, partial [Goodea atripinnis]
MADSFIIAIDFGTAYSGYAFSITSREEDIDPYLKVWGEGVGLETPKTPTCILFDEKEDFISFGYDAKEEYLSKKGQEARDKFLFDCFKMALYGKVSKVQPIIRGGTIDITVHEVLEGGALKELHKASGNDLGGQNVDRKFKQFLREIFCDGVWDEYEQNYPGEVQKIMYDFTLFKKGDKDIEITCSLNLGRLAQTKKDIEKFLEGVEGASWNEGSIKIYKQKLRSFFNESLQGIIESLNDILKRDHRIEYILLVGGYADSQILQGHITEEYIDECKVLCPFRPQEAILKGAVEFGRNPAVVASRKSAFTYGIAVANRFDASKHRADKKYTNKDGEW